VLSYVALLPACVQAAWAEHKKVHTPGPDAWLYCIKRGKGRSMVMPDFNWTGSLRPGKISPARPVSGSQAWGVGCCTQAGGVWVGLTCVAAVGQMH
jgi:hypothetical protein